MDAETAVEAVEAFNNLLDHCFACRSCRATPDVMCREAQQLHRVWKSAWREGLRRDLRKV